MNAQKLRPPLQRDSLLTLAAALLFVVLAFGFAPGVAHSQRDDNSPHERNFENRVPEHVPIKVKVKNPDRAKDLKNEDWLGELEVEVRNTGDKPVYFLYLLLDMPDVKDEAGVPYAVQLHYGRKQLVQMDAPLESGDVPILPGESVTLKVPAGRAAAYKAFWRRKGELKPRKVNFELQFINFGDGTGMDTTQGTPVSAARKERSANSPPPRDGAGGCRKSPPGTETDAVAALLNEFYYTTPASLLRVDFYPPTAARRRPRSRPWATATARARPAALSAFWTAHSTARATSSVASQSSCPPTRAATRGAGAG